MRTLIHSLQSDRPDRRTALVSKRLARFDVDVAALSETRLAGTGTIEEVGFGYTFFWQGGDVNEPRTHRVGFAVKTTLAKKYRILSTHINKRLMSIRVPLSSGNHLSLISAYAPTLTSTDDQKEAFYDQLRQTTLRVLASDKLAVLGDFNACVGRESGMEFLDHMVLEAAIITDTCYLAIALNMIFL